MESSVRSSSSGEMKSISQIISQSTLHLTVEKLNLLQHLSFDKTAIPELFTRTTQFFLVHFADSPFLVKSCFPRGATPASTAVFIEYPFTEEGLNFIGVVKVAHQSKTVLYVKILAEKSYDPAGVTGKHEDNEMISFSHQLFVTYLVSIEVNGFLAGVSEYNVDSLFLTFADYIDHAVKKRYLSEWMHIQVKLACYKLTAPPSYSEFLLYKIGVGALELDNSRIHTKQYLESVMTNKSTGEVNDIELPVQYFQCISPNNALEKRKRENLISTSNDPVQRAKRGVLKNFTLMFDLSTKKGLNIRECDQIAGSLEGEMGECAVT